MCAWELNKTLIQILLLNSHTTIIPVWMCAWELNKTLNQICSLNSHTTRILVLRCFLWMTLYVASFGKKASPTLYSSFPVSPEARLVAVAITNLIIKKV